MRLNEMWHDLHHCGVQGGAFVGVHVRAEGEVGRRRCNCANQTTRFRGLRVILMVPAQSGPR
jgi:hypothetical protein